MTDFNGLTDDNLRAMITKSMGIAEECRDTAKGHDDLCRKCRIELYLRDPETAKVGDVIVRTPKKLGPYSKPERWKVVEIVQRRMWKGIDVRPLCYRMKKDGGEHKGHSRSTQEARASEGNWTIVTIERAEPAD